MTAVVYHRPICHIINDFVRFKVAELEERAGRMCLRFKTAKKVQSVDVEASMKVEKVNATNVALQLWPSR